MLSSAFETLKFRFQFRPHPSDPEPLLPRTPGESLRGLLLALPPCHPGHEHFRRNFSRHRRTSDRSLLETTRRRPPAG